jgi:lipopolysaccharide transport system permease protein
MLHEFELKVEAPKNLSFGFQELWHFRELFYFFTWRDVKVKYKQTTLGIIWVLLQPILTVIIFSVFFGRALKIPSGGIPYPVFVFSGLLFWNAFSASLVNAGSSMISNAQIIRKIYFPRLIIPLSSILVAMVDWSVAFLLFIGMLMFYSVHLNAFAAITLWPAALLLMLTGTSGLCCLFAALNVKYRDFRYIIPFGLQVMLFLTPVIYPINILYVPGLEYVLALNPMYAVIELFRYPILNKLDVVLTSISVVSSILFLGWGLYYFKKTEYYFADLA